jgi:hypothetical protein
MATLGSLACTDYLVNLADGSIVTLDGTTFGAKYTVTSDTEVLTGTDYD